MKPLPSADWASLAAELDAWLAEDRQASLWWRDDDAGPVGGNLRRLVDLAGEGDYPLALAVVPAIVESALVSLLEGAPVAVLQHGYVRAA